MLNEERERMFPKERETRDRNVDERDRKKERERQTDKAGLFHHSIPASKQMHESRERM